MSIEEALLQEIGVEKVAFYPISHTFSLRNYHCYVKAKYLC